MRERKNFKRGLVVVAIMIMIATTTGCIGDKAWYCINAQVTDRTATDVECVDTRGEVWNFTVLEGTNLSTNDNIELMIDNAGTPNVIIDDKIIDFHKIE